MRPASKRCAYLVAVERKRHAVRVYAISAATAAVAVEIITSAAPPRATVRLVGGLSRDLVRRLKLKRGEMRLV